jgi:hypothetical protein
MENMESNGDENMESNGDENMEKILEEKEKRRGELEDF